MLEETAEAMEGHGFTAIKVKVGTNASADVAALGLLREAVGAETLLWVDANSGYGLEDALWAAQGFAEVGVRLFEDPCPLDLSEQTRRLLEESPVPVMVDRPVNSAKSALDYLRLGASALNLKVGSMGYREARRVINVADAHDVSCVIGVGSETDVGSLASLHFRAAVPELDAFPAENIFFMNWRDASRRASAGAGRLRPAIGQTGAWRGPERGSAEEVPRHLAVHRTRATRRRR